MRSLHRLSLGLFLAGLLFSPALTAQEAAPAARIRIVDRVDESRLTTLKGNTPPQARAAFDRGEVTPDLAMGDLTLVLRRSPEQQEAFDKFVASQYDSASPNFHHWLSPDEVGQRFGPSQADVDTTSNWLLRHGFNVDEVSKDRLSIRFSGTSSQTQSTFHTRIHNLDVNGEKHVANMTDPQIPEALTPVIVGVKGLHNFFPKPLHRLGSSVTFNRETGKWERAASAAAFTDTPLSSGKFAARTATPQPRPLFGTTNVYGDVIEEVTPYDFATIYNVLPLWQASTPVDGTGQTIAIAGTSNINLPDVATFRQAFGLPAKAPAVIITNSDPGRCESLSPSCLGDLIENSLDVEWSGAVAKGASIVLVASSTPTTTTDALYLSANYIVQHHTANIMNVSYGACELTLGTAGNIQWSNLWQTAASEGIAVFVASGDAGSAACDQGFDAFDGVPYAAQFGIGVNGIASTPYDTAVGGTDFNWGTTAAPYWSTTNNSTTSANALGYVPEIPWNSTCVNSAIFPALAADATYLGMAPVTDAESACNFITNNAHSIATNNGVNIAGLVDTIGGGGGVSNCTTSNFADPSTCGGGYAKPSWQTGVVGIPADGKRDIPDVAFFASNGFLGSAYLICVSAGDNPCAYSSAAEPTVQEVGGTSAASPAMAGIMALINQKLGSSQGNPNSTLYILASQQTYSACKSETATASGTCLFNDIDLGSNATPCEAGTLYCTVNTPGDSVGVLAGSSATAGFDLTTGLGSLNVANVASHWASVGTGAPTFSLTANALTFPSIEVGDPDPTQTVTLKNIGTVNLTISSISVTGANTSSFKQTNTCGTTVTPNNSCTITVTFTPQTSGDLTAAVSIADNANGSPQSITLAGTGTNPGLNITLTPPSLTFASTPVGIADPPQTVTLKNTSSGTVTFSGLVVSGPNASSFSQTNTCSAVIQPQGTCTFTITFNPTTTGTLTASITLPGSPQSISLTGTGGSAAPSITLTATALTFASTNVGTADPTQSVTLKNTGTASLSITSIAIGGTNAASFAQTNTCGTTVTAGNSCIITVTFNPTTSGTLAAAVTITDNAGTPQTISLSGTATTVTPSITLTPPLLTFASTTVGTADPTQSVTLKNTSTADLAITSISVGGTNAASFAQTNTCGTTVTAGSSCTITVTFNPTTAGTLSAAINIADNATGSPQSITLSGAATAVTPTITLTPPSLTFTSTTVGTADPTQSVTLKNTSTADLSITSITVSGTNAASFAQTNTCGTTVTAGSSCVITVTFNPTTAGTLTAAINIADNATGSPQSISLTGVATSAVPTITLTPPALTFTSTTIGTADPTQSVTLKNTSTSDVSITGITVGGTNAASFAQTNTCGTTVTAGNSCIITVTFNPTTAGTLTASINIADNVTGSPQSIALTGAAVAAAPAVTLTSTALTFASTTVGTADPTQTVTLKNTGTATLSVTGITIGGTNTTSFAQSNTCGASVTAGNSCTITATFNPTTAGTLTASINIADNATGSPQSITLTGTGTAVVVPTATISLTANPTAALVGATVAFNTTVTGNTGTPTGTVTILDGTTTLGTTSLTGGTTSFSTSTLAAGVHTITAKYNGDATFGTVTSTVVTVTVNTATAGITLAAAPASLTITRGASGTSVITATPSNGYAGTLTFICGTLPTDASCKFSSPTLTFTPTSAAQTTTLTISTQGTSALLYTPGGFGEATSAVLAFLLLPILSRRRVRDGLKRHPAIRLAVIAIFMLAATLGVSGCGTSYPPFSTPNGTYTVSVTATNGSAPAATLNLQVTVQ